MLLGCMGGFTNPGKVWVCWARIPWLELMKFPEQWVWIWQWCMRVYMFGLDFWCYCTESNTHLRIHVAMNKKCCWYRTINRLKWILDTRHPISHRCTIINLIHQIHILKYTVCNQDQEQRSHKLNAHIYLKIITLCKPHTYTTPPSYTLDVKIALSQRNKYKKCKTVRWDYA